MKIKIYIGIVLTLILTGFRANAQRDNESDYRHDDSRVVINNYYDKYDYYYSSRINRFHRSYSHFNYYAPVFTDVYWYNYQPYSWGVSIYGGGGLGFGYTESYPGYGYGSQAPYFGSSFYWGYNPIYYSSWYVTPAVNIGFGGFWPHTYYGYNGRDHHYSQHYYEVSQAHNGYNHYSNNYYNNYSNNYYSSNYSNSGRTSNRPAARSANTYSESNRRGTGTSVYRTVDNHSGNNGNNINSSENGNNRKSGSNSPSSFSNWNRNRNRNSTGTTTTTGTRSRYPITDPAKRGNAHYNQDGKRESFSSGSGSSSNPRSTSGSSSSGNVSKGKSSSGNNDADNQSPKSSTSSDKPDRRR
jgi:hypothetical protein